MPVARGKSFPTLSSIAWNAHFLFGLVSLLKNPCFMGFQKTAYHNITINLRNVWMLILFSIYHYFFWPGKLYCQKHSFRQYIILTRVLETVWPEFSQQATGEYRYHVVLSSRTTQAFIEIPLMNGMFTVELCFFNIITFWANRIMSMSYKHWYQL